MCPSPWVLPYTGKKEKEKKEKVLHGCFLCM